MAARQVQTNRLQAGHTHNPVDQGIRVVKSIVGGDKTNDVEPTFTLVGLEAKIRTFEAPGRTVVVQRVTDVHDWTTVVEAVNVEDHTGIRKATSNSALTALLAPPLLFPPLLCNPLPPSHSQIAIAYVWFIAEVCSSHMHRLLSSNIQCAPPPACLPKRGGP